MTDLPRATAASPADSAETDRVRQRYARRDAQADAARYSLLNPATLAEQQERVRAIARGLRRLGWADASALRITEVGCGSGGNLLDWLRLGASAAQLTGIELLPERLQAAQAVLPAEVALHLGDAAQAPVPAASQDVVMQATVFSSLLDDTFQARLAQAMWHWLKPGGVVLWYDFTVNNPSNPDVRGVPLRRVRELFPQAAHLHAERLALAPPLARAVTRLHPSLYPAFNLVPLLRTHVLAWIEKPVR